MLLMQGDVKILLFPILTTKWGHWSEDFHVQGKFNTEASHAGETRVETSSCINTTLHTLQCVELEKGGFWVAVYYIDGFWTAY